MKVAKKETLMQNGRVIGVKFDFTGGGWYELRLDNLPEDLQRQAMAHGLLQKLGDAYANAKGDPKVAEGMFLQVYEAITEKNEWNRKGTATGGLGGLAEALAQITGKDVSVVLAKLQGMEKAEIAALKKRPEVDAKVKELAALAAAAKAEEGAGDDLGDLF